MCPSLTLVGTSTNVHILSRLIPYLMITGIYGSSKSAATTISEVLRLELKPLGVRVITGLIGGVETPIHQNAGDLVLPETSYYHSVKDVISEIHSGAKKAAQPVDVTARAIAGDIVNGKSGRIWRGSFSSTLGWLASLLPYSALVFMVSSDKKLENVQAP